MNMRIEVLYEDDFCLVLNKPAGLAVQGGASVHDSLDAMLQRSYKPRPLLVHRLDRDTSGLILVAKDKTAATLFSKLFEEGRHILKQYLAVCAGRPESGSGIILTDIDVQGKSKKSKTAYKLLHTAQLPVFPADLYPAGGLQVREFSLLELEPGTGRMHQLRRHMALTGNPVLGDDKYGNFRLNKFLGKTMRLKRLLLHAFRLRISSGCGVPALDISAPPPPHFSSFFEQTGCDINALKLPPAAAH